MATTNPIPRGITAKNRQHLTTLCRSAKGSFSVQEASDILSFTTARTPEVPRLPCRERVGHPWIIAAKLLGPDYYIGGWTACEHWGLSDQTFLDTVVVTSRKVRSKRIRVQGVPFLVKRAPKEKMFGTMRIWRDQTRVTISDPSRTLVDVLEYPAIGGGIRHVVKTIGAYFWERAPRRRASFNIRPAGHKRRGFQAIGLSSRHPHIDAPVLLQACDAGVSAGLSRLDPSLPNVGPVVWRWNLRVNGSIQLEKALTSKLCLSQSLGGQPKAARVAND